MSEQSITHRRTIDCNQGAVRAVRYNVDGSYCLTCGSDKKIKLWNPNSGLLLKTYGGHADEVTDVVGSCDSSFILSSSLDKSIIYWDVSTGSPVRRLRVHAGGVNCVRFNEDSSIAVSGSKDNTVLCWDIRTRKLDPVQRMAEAKDCITSICVTEHKIVSASLDGCIRQYDIRAGELTCDDIGVPISHLVQTKDSPCVVAACLDGVIRLIDLDSGDLLQEYKGHKTKDYHIECGVMKDDSQIISGTTEGYGMVWDLMEGKEINKLLIGRDVIHSLCTHPTNSDVIFARRREIQLWGAPKSVEDDEEVTFM